MTVLPITRAIVAEGIDKQVATIIHSLDIASDWRKKMAELATTNREGPSTESLKEKRRRLIQAYADGGFTEGEYRRRLAEIDRQIEQACVTTTTGYRRSGGAFFQYPDALE